MSAEPSMEEILSSIKRIIAEEGDGPVRQRRPQRSSATSTAAVPPPAADAALPPVELPAEVLELSEAIAAAPPLPAPDVPAQPARRDAPEPAAPDSILSSQTAAASRGSLESLSRLVVRPGAESDGTLEGLVRAMLKPMLREWLDANLPDLVEGMVAREIAKITGQPG